jgi:hypothetical protein
MKAGGLAEPGRSTPPNGWSAHVQWFVENQREAYSPKKAVMSLDPTGKGQKRWITRWKPALNAFEIAFEGRLSAAHK